jgi:hypothetical protein
MKAATQIIIKLASAAAIILLLSNCASTFQTVDHTTAAVADCSTMEWDACAMAPQCRHARDWVENSTGLEEIFVCESKPPVFASGEQTPVRLANAQ